MPKREQLQPQEKIIDKNWIMQEFCTRLNQLHLINSNGKRGLKMDQETEKAIKLIVAYLAKDKKFEEAGFDFKKGLCIQGNFGSGKTEMAKAFMYVKKKMGAKVTFMESEQMNERFMKIDKYSQRMDGYNGIKHVANQYDDVERIFDDLGDEEITLNHYGNKICVMAYIIKQRYKGRNNGCITHLTTNLTRKEIEQDYGERLNSRIHEYFNFIPLGTKKDSIDYRKTKIS